MSQSECCSKDPAVVTRIQFLESKATNFKKYVESFNPDETVKTYIESFRPELLSQTITTVVVPIVELGQIEFSVDELLGHLTLPEGSRPEVKKRLTAYIQMFYDVLMEAST